jgi:hypothetical protein
MNIITRIEKIIEIYKESDLDVKPLNELLDLLYKDKKDKGGNQVCNLITEGYCLYVLNEECPGYDTLDSCPLKLAGLWWCGEIGELVNEAECKDCNEEQDCGCCDSVHSGVAPFNCTKCGRKKVEVEAGIICLDPNLTEEQVAEEVARCNEDPNAYFRC